MRRSFVLLGGVLALCACAPKAAPLTGVIAPARIPDTSLPPVYQKIVFDWSFSDGEYRAKGDGAARVAPPDSVRLDFFVSNGMGGGYAQLVGDSLTVPSEGRVHDYLPPVPMIWATLGRFAVPPLPDTAARVDGDTLRVEIGRNPRWRATFASGALRRLELIDGDRIRERTTRNNDRHVIYERTGAHRSLDLTVVRIDTVPDFDASIWH
ncbi:MAG TPA: hypothetical protein VJO52_12180 [Gemmatimonadaceae bacterium]|nr:hypothetical protein [Gemmatimonadaceae bacterium]